MSITIKEIARLAGTSRGTVDRVFHKRGKVSKDLERKILEVAREFNYSPNETAKLLVASQKQFVIGVVINSIGNAFFEDVKRGIARAASKMESYNIGVEIVELKGYIPEEQVAAIDQLLEKGMNALAITPVESKIVRERLTKLNEEKVPYVFINSDIEDLNRLAMVGADNKESGCLAGDLVTMYLQEKSRVAIVTGSYSNLGNKKRVFAFSKVINECEKEMTVVDVLENHDDDNLSYQIVVDLIKRNASLDLIYFCAGGIEGGIRAIRESGRDIKAITVDESDAIKQGLVEGLVLASITQDPFEQGYKPMKILANYLVFGKEPEKNKIYTESKIKLMHSKW